MRFEAGNCLEVLKSYCMDEFTGAVHLKTDKALGIEQKNLILSFHKGAITFVDRKLPTMETLTGLIKKNLNLPHIDSAIKAALSRVREQNSIRERLEFVSRFGVFKWEDLEAVMQNRAVSHLEQVLPCTGVLSRESPIAFDLSYGNDGHGFDWEKLQQALVQRDRMWQTLVPHIPSMNAVPIRVENRQTGMPPAMQKHLEQWMNGQRSLVEIANGIDQDPLKLAKHYLPWIQKGCIDLRPSLGNGSQFETQPERAKSLVNDLGEKPIILSVDDSSIVQTMIKRAIGDRYQVMLANNAVDALDLLNTYKIDLLLLDVTMPDIDGLQLCSTIRGISKFRDLPVVMLTAKDGLFDKVKGQFVGSTHYLTKPVDREKLLPVIARYVDQAQPVSALKA
jgi:CheY-like chemotaxis protein